MITGSSFCRLCRLHIWPTAQWIFMEHHRVATVRINLQRCTGIPNSGHLMRISQATSTLRVVLSFSICPPGETCDKCPPGGKVQTFLKFWTRRNARQKKRPDLQVPRKNWAGQTRLSSMCSSLRRCSAQQPRRSRSFSKSGSPRKSR